MSKKDDVWKKKGLRVSLTKPRTPLTGGAEMHQRGVGRVRRKRKRNQTEARRKKKSEANKAGRAK
jgi:hypothetical protein